MSNAIKRNPLLLRAQLLLFVCSVLIQALTPQSLAAFVLSLCVGLCFIIMIDLEECDIRDYSNGWIFIIFMANGLYSVWPLYTLLKFDFSGAFIVVFILCLVAHTITFAAYEYITDKFFNKYQKV